MHPAYECGHEGGLWRGKLITANGVVTLRGPVQTAAEKAQIDKLARKAAGKVKIQNQLEVKATK